MPRLYVSPTRLQKRAKLRRQANRLLHRANRRVRAQRTNGRFQTTVMESAFTVGLQRWMLHQQISFTIPSDSRELSRLIFFAITSARSKHFVNEMKPEI
jgi:hypothetical protein